VVPLPSLGPGQINLRIAGRRYFAPQCGRLDTYEAARTLVKCVHRRYSGGVCSFCLLSHRVRVMGVFERKLRVPDGVMLCIAVIVSAGFLVWAAGQTPGWHQMSPSQQAILAPVAKHWDELTHRQRQWLLKAAQRYPGMSAAQRERFNRRLTQWVRLSVEERADARATYLAFARLNGEDRVELQNRWLLENYR
jgi:hypothetical protein